MNISNTYPQSAILQNDTAGTGPASPPIDSSLTLAEQLFALFSEDLFSAELDIIALQKILTSRLISCHVPFGRSLPRSFGSGFTYFPAS